MDIGYNDYGHFGKLTGEGICFVTRLMNQCRVRSAGRRPGSGKPEYPPGQLIHFTGEKAQGDCPSPLLRVVVWDPVNEREIVLLTSPQDFGATTIAAIYNDRYDRWQIQRFLNALKENLKVKKIEETSPNGLYSVYTLPACKQCTTTLDRVDRRKCERIRNQNIK